MPRRWTNAYQWTGDTGAFRALARELRHQWERRQQAHTIRNSRDTYTEEHTP